MSKNMPEVKIHYGQKDFENIMRNIVKVQLKEFNTIDNKKNYEITVYDEKAVR